MPKRKPPRRRGSAARAAGPAPRGGNDRATSRGGRRAAPKAVGPTAVAPKARAPAASSASEASGTDAGAPAAPAAPEVLLPPYPVVGIGASAGGLEAVTQLLQAVPPKPGAALVLVQHLSPDHESRLPELLAAVSPVTVVRAAHGMRVERDKLYVVPPDVQMEIRARGVLRLSERPTDHTQHMPIDFFFRSLAEFAQVRAVGVVLSGTGSDGAAGLREIKAAGGITLAQEPASARHDGMPRAAVATGTVDHVLPPKEIAAELVRISRHPLVAAAPTPRTPEDLLHVPEEQLARIFSLLRSTAGVDFSNYKLPTIKRRLHRRMVLHKIAAVGQYVRLLQDNPAEVRSLCEDILIHVTRFFRDPESFKALREHVFPRLLDRRSTDAPVRIWVPGCSTGEEAYSVAVALLEYLAESGVNVPVQVFATDVSESVVERARAGVYPESIAADVSAERLRRFFTRRDGHYVIGKQVRDVCVFARQDLTRDPPFSRLDLVVCRNVLIYLGPVLQKRLMALFHYALNHTGFLMLGSSESIGGHAELFAVADKRHRVYSRRVAVGPPTGRRSGAAPASPRRPTAGGAAAEGAAAEGAAPAAVPRGLPAAPHAVGGVQKEANRVLLARYVPPGVIVDPDLNIIQFRGQTGPYLEPAPGDASLNLLKMARDGLLFALRTTLFKARRGEGPVRAEGLRVKVNGSTRAVDVEVIPLVTPGEPRHFLVLFQDRAAPEQEQQGEKGGAAGRTKGGGKPARGKAARRARGVEADERVRRLEDELAATREYLQSIVQDSETSNEELQSANEEILSSNEELQSTNEELDTAKEELQSSNQELNTVNDELQARNEQLGRVNSDLVNLLASVQIAIVMVDGNMRIRRFTPVAERLFKLIPSDVGRPLGDIKPGFQPADLEQLVARAVSDVTVQEREVSDRDGNRLSLRVRPYKNLDNKIDGAVLAVLDTEGAYRQAEAQAAWEYANALLETVHEPLLVLDRELRVRTANGPFLRAFSVTAAETEGRLVYDLGNGQWNTPKLRSLLEKVLPENGQVRGYVVEHEFPGIGRKRMRLNARRVDHGDRDADRILLAITEVAPDSKQRERKP